MFAITEDLSIYVTRGDDVRFSLNAEENGVKYTFKAGDVVRIKVFEKKACDKVVLQKDFPVETNSDDVEIHLTEQDTRIGGIISKPVDYWYEVELNPFTDPQTIIAYDDDGAKVFRLFPEGRDLEDGDISEEDIPVVDDKLDMTSTRPVQNQAIARAVAEINESIKKTNADTLAKVGGTMTGSIAMSGHKVTGLGNPTEDGDAVSLKYANENFAPATYITDLFSLNTEEEFEAKISEIYNSMTYNTRRLFVVNLDNSGTEVLKGSWFVEIVRFTINYGYVKITNENYGNMIRRNRSGEWHDWESETPPAMFGVEYRTTERWNGAVVYTKFIDCGKLKNGAFIAAPEGATRIVRYSGSFGPFLMPVGEKGESNYSYLVSAFPDVGLTLKCNGVGDYTTYVQIWYIK